MQTNRAEGFHSKVAFLHGKTIIRKQKENQISDDAKQETTYSYACLRNITSPIHRFRFSEGKRQGTEEFRQAKAVPSFTRSVPRISSQNHSPARNQWNYLTKRQEATQKKHTVLRDKQSERARERERESERGLPVHVRQRRRSTDVLEEEEEMD
jgi:alpha-D-ribose 1-methylphosphonate 5-triphosphate diphosphatase PhnM